MSNDDISLMLRVSRGDVKAFRTLVERHQQAVYNFFLRSTANADDAEDLTQQLFINLYRSAGRYRPTASFKTFLYRIASNLAASFGRKSRHREGVSLDVMMESGYDPGEGTEGGDPAVHTEYGELQRAYLHALERLPADQRTAIELKVSRGLPYKEIAGIMKKSVSSVESLIFRARERLADELRAFKEPS